MLRSSLILALLLGCTLVSAQLLANGSALASGSISASVKWQSSGVFRKGGCPAELTGSCYTASLSASGQRVPHNRQRIELLSWPPADNGERWTYDWDYYLAADASSSEHFFHLMQLLSRDISGFVIALDLYNSTIRLFDTLRDCTKPRCPSIAVAEFEGKLTRHHMDVMFGALGFIDYHVTDADSNLTLLSYTVNGSVPADASLKTGLYRLVQKEQSNTTAYISGLDFRRVGRGRRGA